MGCVERESPAMVRIAEDGVWYWGATYTSSSKINARFCQFCSGTRSVWRGHGNALRPSCTKPTRRTFDLQDHRVRAAVRQALKNAAYASSARPRGSAGPIRAEPLYCQFDLPGRRHSIGSYEFFLILCHLVPDNLYVCRASRL